MQSLVSPWLSERKEESYQDEEGICSRSGRDRRSEVGDEFEAWNHCCSTSCWVGGRRVEDIKPQSIM